MKMKIKKEKAIAASATTLLFASLIGTGLFYNSNTSLSDLLNKEKLKAETLLSEKLALDKQIDRFKRDIAALQGKNIDLDKLLAKTSDRLTQKEAEFEKISKENARAKWLERQLSEIKKMKIDLENQIAELNLNMEQLKSENGEYSKTLAALEEENKALTENNRLLSAMAADNFRVETYKGKKDKLTLNSRRTKKMVVGFDLPQSIASNIEFRITTPQGNLLTGKDETITTSILENENSLVASLSPLTKEFEITRRIEMTYKPKEKLSGGIYKIDIYNKETYLGSCQVRLK